MKVFWAYVKKEFWHIWRDSRTVLILILMPVVQVLLFGFAITTEVKNSSFAILDHCKTKENQELIDKITASKYFDLYRYSQNISEINNLFERGDIKLALVFHKEKLQIIIDASNPNESNIIANYINGIIADYNKLSPPIEVETHMLYNPQLKSAYTYVPGVIGLVIMLICSLMTSVSIVKEKELGSMELLLISPSKPIYIVLSKTVPYFIISIFNIVLVSLLSIFVFSIPIKGSIFLLLIASIIYVFTSLGLGLFISAVSRTQQVAMIISLMGLMLPTVLLSGLMFPIESMPKILQWTSCIVPATWFISMVKIIMIKGLGLAFVWKHLCILCLMATLFIGISIKCFRERL